LNLNHDRIRSKLNDISAAVRRLNKFQSLDREWFLADEDSQDIARSRLLTAIEAALNICYHLSAKKLHRVPEDYAQCFAFLGETHIIAPQLAERLALMARFRNRLVHLYWDIDYGQVYDIIKNDLGDLDAFAREVAQLL
jgi:uncharacterized protein YutE (UPF0331/DUF86 family)